MTGILPARTKSGDQDVHRTGSTSVVNADGQLFSCWENAGRRGWDVGHVDSGFDETRATSDRWVACDFEIEPHGDPKASRRFTDYVDAAALDQQLDRRHKLSAS
jgi:uncharacterized protein